MARPVNKNYVYKIMRLNKADKNTSCRIAIPNTLLSDYNIKDKVRYIPTDKGILIIPFCESEEN